MQRDRQLFGFNLFVYLAKHSSFPILLYRLTMYSFGFFRLSPKLKRKDIMQDVNDFAPPKNSSREMFYGVE